MYIYHIWWIIFSSTLITTITNPMDENFRRFISDSTFIKTAEYFLHLISIDESHIDIYFTNRSKLLSIQKELVTFDQELQSMFYDIVNSIDKERNYEQSSIDLKNLTDPSLKIRFSELVKGALCINQRNVLCRDSTSNRVIFQIINTESFHACWYSFYRKCKKIELKKSSRSAVIRISI